MNDSQTIKAFEGEAALGGKPTSRLLTAPKSIVFSAGFAGMFIAASVLVGLGGLFAFSSDPQNARRAIPILILNFGLLAILAAYLLWRIWTVLFSKKAGDAAPQLHRRFLVIFSLAAILPALVVGTFFGTIMSRDISDLLNTNVRQVMSESRIVSNAYLNRELERFRPDVRTLAATLNQSADMFSDRISYSNLLINQAVFWEFPAVYVIDSNGQVLAKAESPSTPDYKTPTPDVWEIAQDAKGTLTVGERIEIDYLVALVRLDRYDDAYLYTGRYLLETGILSSLDNMDRLEESVTRLTSGRGAINSIFLLTYIQAALLILMAAIWLGLVLASRIVRPLGQMVLAAEKVQSGDLSARVNVTGVWDEISDLAGAFNRMTRQLGTQRDALVREHEISEQSRQFSEAVLSGVSAGVIGLSAKGKITLMNKSAETLLQRPADEVLGLPLAEAISPFQPAFTRAIERVHGMVDDQVNVETPTGIRNFDLRVSPYRGDRKDTGWVMTFDDMTRLVAAQRHSAWREVARRIAHEIKNPLTPIQLSAERLERKYAKEITSDPQTFISLTRTITRQVESLGNMVDAFSEFAKMPAPILEAVDFRQLLELSMFEQRVAFPEIRFTLTDNAPQHSHIICDERLMGQALMNLLKNAGESVTGRMDTQGLNERDGRIDMMIEARGGNLQVSIVDNGSGWPLADKERLFEPYVTTRESGTGLGLAIVKRVIEDHGGALSLSDRPGGETGAYVHFTLPLALTDLLSNDIPSPKPKPNGIRP
ncbi:MAG: ATP-binding protein [Robiginitomaculum sp.]